MIRPVGDLGLYLAGADAFPDYERSRVWFRDNDRFRRDVLEAPEEVGPARLARDPRHAASSRGPRPGWTNNRNVTQMLEFLAIPRRGRDRRARRPRAAVGSPRARLPGRPTCRRPRRPSGGRNERRLASLGIARAKATEDADGAGPRRGGRRARNGRGREGRVARRSGLPGRRLRGAHRAAVAVRPADPRPRPGRGAVRLRVLARDVQAGREAPLGLLRATDPPRGPADREARRGGRPEGRRPAHERDPRGRASTPARCATASRPSSKTSRPGSASIWRSGRGEAGQVLLDQRAG